MKSYYLENIKDKELAVSILNKKYPGQTSPWLIRTEDNSDIIGYIDIIENDIEFEGINICIDISGRHYDEDELVLNLLNELKTLVSGKIIYSP